MGGLLLCGFLGGRSWDETIHPSCTRATSGDGNWIGTGADSFSADPVTGFATGWIQIGFVNFNGSPTLTVRSRR